MESGFLTLLSFACYEALLGKSDFRNQREVIQQAIHGPVGGFRWSRPDANPRAAAAIALQDAPARRRADPCTKIPARCRPIARIGTTDSMRDVEKHRGICVYPGQLGV